MVTVAEGVDVVVVAAFDAVWHLSGPGDEAMNRRTLCGLFGPTWSAAMTRGRRPCQVCVSRAPKDMLIQPVTPGKKRGKPRGKYRRVTDIQVRALHLLHWEQRVSINEISRRYYKQFGYSDHRSLCSCLCGYFKELGLPTHDRIAMTVEASTTNGLSPRDWTERKARRLAAGRTQKGKVRQPACARCAQPAQHGSDFCYAHDPACADQRATLTAAMRARSPILNRIDLEPAAPLEALLLAYRETGGSWRALSRATGCPDAWLAHVATGKQARVDIARARSVRAALSASGGTVGDPAVTGSADFPVVDGTARRGDQVKEAAHDATPLPVPSRPEDLALELLAVVEGTVAA